MIKLPLKVFISYSKESTPFVNSLYSILKQNGIEVLTDWHEAYSYSSNLFNTIKDNIQQSDIVIFFLSKEDVDKDFVKEEITIAKTFSRNIIPILLPDATLPIQLFNYPYVVIDDKNPEATLTQIINYSNQVKKEKNRDNMLGLLLLSGALFLLASAFSEESKEESEEE